jgi:hypothetical protein
MAQLEEGLRRQPAFGVRIPVALTGMLAAIALLTLERQDLSYFLSPRAPLTLGREGQYRFEDLRSNRYVQIHGSPSLRGAYWKEKERTFVLVGLRETPILVRRAALATEEWAPGTTPPQPDQRRFSVKGRLLAEADAPRYREGMKKLESGGEVQTLGGRLWILLEGELPGADWSAFFIGSGLCVFFAVNAWFFGRGLAARFSAAKRSR